jgi:hypothetical protein
MFLKTIGIDAPSFTHYPSSRRAIVDNYLVDHRQVTMPFLELDLIHADGRHAIQIAMVQTIFHYPGRRTINFFPTGLKDGRDLSPAQRRAQMARNTA